MTFTQSELKAAAAVTANTTDAPRSCGYIVKGGKRWLLFPHKSGNLYAVKERTQAQIYRALAQYMRPDEIARYTYIGGQQISDCNGNIYADFIDGGGFKHHFYIADYNDYINEIAEA